MESELYLIAARKSILTHSIRIAVVRGDWILT